MGTHHRQQRLSSQSNVCKQQRWRTVSAGTPFPACCLKLGSPCLLQTTCSLALTEAALLSPPPRAM